MTCFVVFSDLDGTLLDHVTADWSPAAPAIEALLTRGIPLVLASSRTAAEIAPLREALGFGNVPAIVENGAGILPGGAQPGEDRIRHTRLRSMLDEVPQHLRFMFEGFTDWGIERVMAETGMSREAAKRASLRQFSEQGVFNGTEGEEERFAAALAERGVITKRSGRYLTLSFGRTKADRMAEILGAYGRCHTLALGDAPNDIDMIEAADNGVIVSNPHGVPIPMLNGEREGRVRRTRLSGPSGWNDAVMRFVDEYEPAVVGH